MAQLEPKGELSDHQSSKGAYRSFLIRLWQSHTAGTWHVSLQSVQTGTTLHFADLSALFAFLGTETAHRHATGEVGAGSRPDHHTLSNLQMDEGGT